MIIIGGIIVIFLCAWVIEQSALRELEKMGKR